MSRRQLLAICAADLGAAEELMKGVAILDAGGEVEIRIGSEEDCFLTLDRDDPLRSAIRKDLIATLKKMGVKPCETSNASE